MFTWKNVESILHHCRTEVLCILAKLLSELIRNDGILITQQSFKQPAVGIKTRSVKNRVVSPEETAQLLLQRLVSRLGATNKAN